MVAVAIVASCGAATEAAAASIMLVIANSSEPFNATLIAAAAAEVRPPNGYLLTEYRDEEAAASRMETSATATSTADREEGAQRQQTPGKIDVYTAIAIGTGGLVLVAFMVTTVVLYKMRVNYLLQRQLNQFRRVEAQLRLDSLSDLMR